MHEETKLRCLGCGVALQTENKEGLGYLPASALSQGKLTCQRCFQITHYNRNIEVEMNDDDFRKIIDQIGDAQGLVIKLVDMFDLSGSWISGIERFVRGNPILLLGNKMDLFPERINTNRIKNWMQQSAKEWGVKPIDILFCSAEKGVGLEELVQAMDRYRNHQDIYIVGTTNVGKSTLINQLLKRFGGRDEQLVTTSRFPGTTLDLVAIPLDGESVLYDTPGIVNRQQMAHYVSEEELKQIMPQQRVKPKVYQLNAAQSLFFGGLARFDFVQGKRQSFVCYMSNQLPIHRTKLEKADELYRLHLGELLSPPAQPGQDWKLHKQTFKLDKQPTDIVIPGLGWVSVKGEGAIIETYAPQGVHISLRKTLL